MQYGEEMLTLVTKERDTLANLVPNPNLLALLVQKYLIGKRVAFFCDKS